MTGKPKEKEPKREAGPKFKSVIPESFRIRRAPSPMADILREAETPRVEVPPVEIPRVEITPGTSAPPTPAVSEPPLPETTPRAELPPLPANAPHLRLPYVTLDRLRLLKAPLRSVCEEIYRAAAGWHSDECTISIAKLSVYCRIDDKLIRKYIAQLQALGYLERLDEARGGDAQGARFRILLPRMAAPVKSTPGRNTGGADVPPIKENALKKDSKSVVCDLCRDMNGMVYGDRNDPSKGVKRCDHSGS